MTSKEDKITVLIIDMNAMMHRFYHALPRFTTPTGQPIQAVYGLANTLLRILREVSPTYVFACFDTPEPTFRHKLSPVYKITRPKVDDELKIQLSLAKELLRSFHIPIIERSGYEADDLIGALARAFNEQNKIILTGDLDTLQLVNDTTKVYIFRRGISQIDIYDRQKVVDRFGLPPEHLADFKSLVGDASDNILGVKGIGDKTAAKLLQQFGTIENLIDKIDKLSDPKLRSKISAQREQLLLNKHLAAISSDIDLKLEPLQPYQLPSLAEIQPQLLHFGFKSIIKRLQGDSYFTRETPSMSKTKPTDLFKSFSIESVAVTQKDQGIIVVIATPQHLYSWDGRLLSDPPPASLKALLKKPSKKIVFGLKEIARQIFSSEPSYQIDPTSQDIFDLKLATWLCDSALTKMTLAKFVNIKSTQLITDELAQVDFFIKQSQALTEATREQLQQLDLVQLFELEQRISLVLARMEIIGLLLDQQALADFRESVRNELEQVESSIYQLAGQSFKLNSPKELRQMLFNKLRLPTAGLIKTPKGEISTQESELEKLRSTHPVVAKILQHRQLIKIYSTYTNSLLKFVHPQTGRLHTTFDQTGTVTGRLSSEKPNLQNLPIQRVLAKNLRRVFQPALNYLFLGFDYSQLELRLAAHLSQDETLLLAFKQGLDIHSMTSKILFKTETEKSRRLAKVINFGIIYGISAKTLSRRLNLSLAEAQELIDSYFHKFPGMKKLRDDLIERAKTYGYAETLTGRKRFIPEILSQAYRERLRAERIAINMPIQGLAADIMKLAMVKIDEYLMTEKLFPDQARVVLQVHDELVLEVKQELVYNLETKVKEIMENAYHLSVPLVVNVHLGKSLADLHN